MADDMFLNGAAGPVQGIYFLLLDPEEAEDDESVLAVGRRVENALEIRPLSDFEEIVSVDVLPGSGFDGAIFCGLTADGTLMFSDGERLWSEVVPNEGAYRDGQRILRRLRTVRYVDGALFVAGFGGQVYRRGDGEAWRDISFEAPELIGGNALFYHIVPGDRGAPVFAGIFAHTREVTDAMKAASAAGDAELFLKLKRAAKKPDHILVAEYRDRWEVLFTDHPGVASWLSPRRGGGYYLVSDSGIVWETADFLSLNERWAPASPEPFDDIKVYDGEPLFLLNGQLLRLGDGGMTPFEPQLPASVPPMGLWGGETLTAIHRDAVWVLDGDRWVQLELRLA